MTHQPGVYVPLRALFLVFFAFSIVCLNVAMCDLLHDVKTIYGFY